MTLTSSLDVLPPPLPPHHQSGCQCLEGRLRIKWWPGWFGSCIQLLIQWTTYVHKMCHILLQNMKQTQILKHNFSPCSKTGPYLGSCPHEVLTAACGCHPKAPMWQPPRGDPGVLVPTTILLGHLRKANYVLSLFFFFLDVFDNPSFINTCSFKEDSFVHHHAPSAQGINHGQRRTRSHMKNIYVLIVLRAWPGNWEFKGQKFYFVFLIFQEIKRPTTQRLIEIHFLLSSAC